MEIVLLLIAGVVVYFLYNTLQEYLKNPLHQNPQFNTNRIDNTPIDFKNPYQEMTHIDKVKSSEFGVLAAILGRVVWSDEKMCPLEEQLVDEMLTDMAQEAKNPKMSKEELKDILMEQKSSNIALEELCDEYVLLTKGEYKKRLKVVEFLFVIAYADGSLAESERDCIIDIAALFEISNEDFNVIFEQFEQEYAKEISMNEEKAKEIFDIKDENITKESLTHKYNELIKSAKQNIFDNKNINKSFHNTSLIRIKEIDGAYTLLLESLSRSGSLVEDTKEIEKITEKGDKAHKGWDF